LIILDRLPLENTINNTTNGKSVFLQYKNEIQNDSALSSFHNHNINNRLKENKHRHNKSTSTKNEKYNTISTDNMNSKDNFFPKPKNLRSYRNNRDLEIDNSEKGGDSKNSSPLKKSETNFKFTGQGFNGSISSNDSKNKLADSNDEYSNYNLEKKILEQRENLGNEEDGNDRSENMNQFSQSGTFKSKSNVDNISGRFNYYQTDKTDNLDSNMNSYNNFNTQQHHMRKYSESISEDINSIRFNKPGETVYHSGYYSNTNNNTGNYYNYDIKTQTNDNFSNRNHNVIKNDIDNYLSDLISKNYIRLKKFKNQWVLDFNETNNELNSEYGGSKGFVKEENFDDTNRKNMIAKKIKNK
jgi:hypothetical protein